MNEFSSIGNPRLPYMGHIVLIAEELVKFISRCPSDLFAVIEPNLNMSGSIRQWTFTGRKTERYDAVGRR
jgi:hypothetical protein